MDFKQLDYFIHVAELASFTRASIELNVAQPALSRQIRMLEVELQQHLFIRNGRGVTMTDAGKKLLEHARGIVHQVARTREELSRQGGALVGRVALGIPPGLMKSLAVSLTHIFKEHFPHASLTMSEGLSISMQESLSTGRLDIALLYNTVPSSEIDTIPLIEEEMFLVESNLKPKPTSKTITLRELSDMPLIVPCRPNSTRMMLESEMANIGCKPTVALEIDSISAILSLVANQQGNAFLTKNAMESLGDRVKFHTRKVVSPELKSKLMLATCTRHPTTLVQESFINILQTHFSSWLSMDEVSV